MEEVVQTDLKISSDLVQRVDGGIDATAFQHAHVRSMQAARIGERFLRNSPLNS